MTKVIGYKDDAEERRANWLSMLMFKDNYQGFKNSTDPWEKEIAERDKTCYDKFLSNYIKASEQDAQKEAA